MNTVIYIRVSSDDQINGTSLRSQEAACREYAQRQNLTVTRVFAGEGESAKLSERPELLELLSYCQDKKNAVEVLLVWKFDRFARRSEDHFAFKASLRTRGVRVVSVTENTDDSPQGKLFETMLAAIAEFDNEVRTERSKLGMQQRLKQGIFPWKPPLGYLSPKLEKKTEPDRPDPERFEYLQKGWQLLLSGAYTKKAVLRELREWGVRAWNGGVLWPQALDEMFSNPYYAGLLRDPWTGAEYQGRHVAMVTPQDFARVQTIVARRKNSQPHHRLRKEFPLRGHVLCPHCQLPMTASFSQGSTARYGYYDCRRAACGHRTSYPVGQIHREFTGFIGAVTVEPQFAVQALRALVEAHQQSQVQARKALTHIEADIRRFEAQLRELIAMRSAQLIANDEFLIQRNTLRKGINELRASLVTTGVPGLTEDELHTCATWLADLTGLWNRLGVAGRDAFARLIFRNGYVFQKVRTTQPSRLFKVFEPSDAPSSYAVRPDFQEANAIILEIREFLSIVSSDSDPEKEAA